jgi:nitronate monooxygenase
VGTAFTELVGIEHPLVQAPMANGPSTVELAASVSNAGALGTIAGATLAPDVLRHEIRAVRALTGNPFAVNLFAPLPPLDAPADAVAAVTDLRAEYGLGPPPPLQPPVASFDDQLQVLVDEHVRIFSFTFGIPPLDALEGVITIGTATTVEEAQALETAGVDVVAAQGAEAGGHRGTFLGAFEDALVPLDELVASLVDATSQPVVAAGGLMDGADVARVLALGAAGAQLGTAFLFTRESGAPPVWREALRSSETIVSDRYTGRPARGARTPFLDALGALEAAAPYPLQAQLLADLRTRDGYGWYLGGTGARRARELPAAELVRTLAAEIEAAAAPR